MIDLGVVGNFIDKNFVLISRVLTVRKNYITPLVRLNREKLSKGITYYTE